MNRMVETDLSTLGIRAPGASRLYRFYVLGVLLIVGVFSWVDRQVFAIVLESIKHDLLLSDTQLGLLGGIAFGLFYAAIGLPIAWLADRSNRRNIIAGAVALWSAMTALCGLASGFASLFITRMGVGIGEAGAAPPSQSLLSDYFPPQRRGLALGILYTYVPLGYVVAFATGGWLNQTYGWRWTFSLFGLPGLLLALLVATTVRELPRGSADTIQNREPAPPMLDTVRHFLGCRSLRNIALAGALHGIGAFGASVWMPAYFMRVHGMSSAQIGSALALIMGTAGLAGALTGGYVVDRLVARTGNVRWYARVPSLAALGLIPFTLLMYSTSGSAAALLLYIVPAFLNHVLLGPVTATIQNLVGARRRAMGAAFYLFLVNLISMGLGPFVIGFCSDFFRARYGDDSLRYALLYLVSATSLWASIHFYLASRTLPRDMAAEGAS